MLYASLTDRLKNQHTSLRVLIAGLDNDRLNCTTVPGKWSIHYNIAHLVVYQPIFINRINNIITNSNPVFAPYRADDDETFIAWRKWDTNDLLIQLDADRGRIYQLITNLTEEDTDRKGTHLKYGTLTVTQWAEFFLLHEAHHQFTIFRLVQE